LTKTFYILALLLVGLRAIAQKPINLFPDTTGICQGDSVLLKFPEDVISNNATYQWNTTYAIIYHAKQLYISKPGTYSVKIYDGNRIIIDTTYLKVYERPRIRIRDTSMCSGAPIVVEAKNKNYRYYWSTEEISNSIKIEHPGTYWVRASNKGCVYTDTFRVTTATGVVPNFSREMVFCEGDENKTLSVRTNGDTKLYWNTGAQTSSINAQKEGIYWVRSVSAKCGKQTDSVTVKFKNCECEMYVPTSFTPNDDDKNDYFYPVCQCEYQYFNITVYDRWGNVVYSSNNINSRWDGKFKGNLCPDDVYVYRIEAQQKNSDKKTIRSGHISLFR